MVWLIHQDNFCFCVRIRTYLGLCEVASLEPGLNPSYRLFKGGNLMGSHFCYLLVVSVYKLIIYKSIPSFPLYFALWGGSDFFAWLFLLSTFYFCFATIHYQTFLHITMNSAQNVAFLRLFSTVARCQFESADSDEYMYTKFHWRSCAETLRLINSEYFLLLVSL